MLKRLFLMGALALAAGYAHADINWEVYRQLGHINDYAQILNDRERLNLERLLQDFQTQYGVNLTLFTVPQLSNYRIDETTRYMYDQWDLGRGSGNQSALMLLSREDGILHLYVGMGLRGVLNSQWTKKLSEYLQPILEKRQFDRAAVDAMALMANRVYNERSALPKRSPRFFGSQGLGNISQKDAVPIALTVAGGFVIFLLISTFFQAKKGDDYVTGTDFERNRTGPFGNKKPRWL